MLNEGYSDNLHLILTATSKDEILTTAYFSQYWSYNQVHVVMVLNM